MTWPLDPAADSKEHSETHRDLYNFMSLKCLASSTDCPKEKKGGQTNRVKNTNVYRGAQDAALGEKPVRDTGTQ